MDGPRGTFDEDAELYDRMRPRYPTGLVDSLTGRAGLTTRSRVLEVGPGTGQLTVPLAKLGCAITAVELGSSLAGVARRNLRSFPRVRVELGAFEEWTPPLEPFDAMVCATAIHWIDPVHRFTKAARALRPGGTLALVTTHHVAGAGDALFERIQGCYERWDPATPKGLRPRDPSLVSTAFAELDRPPWEGPVRVDRHLRDLTYTTAQYLDVLMTYSGHRALAPDSRRGLFDCIGALIDHQGGGSVTKRYLHELITVRKAG